MCFFARGVFQSHSRYISTASVAEFSVGLFFGVGMAFLNFYTTRPNYLCICLPVIPISKLISNLGWKSKDSVNRCTSQKCSNTNVILKTTKLGEPQLALF